MKFFIATLILSSSLSFAQSTNGGRPGGAGAGGRSAAELAADRVAGDSQVYPAPAGVTAGSGSGTNPLIDDTCYMGGFIGGSFEGRTVRGFDLDVKDCNKEGDIIRCPDGVYRRSNDVNDQDRTSGKEGGTSGGSPGSTTSGGSSAGSTTAGSLQR